MKKNGHARWVILYRGNIMKFLFSEPVIKGRLTLFIGPFLTKITFSAREGRLLLSVDEVSDENSICYSESFFSLRKTQFTGAMRCSMKSL